MRQTLHFKIKETSSVLYLECEGGFDIGYEKPLQKPKEDIIKEFKDRVKYYNGILD